jgi:hypothetical protein
MYARVIVYLVAIQKNEAVMVQSRVDIHIKNQLTKSSEEQNFKKYSIWLV